MTGAESMLSAELDHDHLRAELAAACAELRRLRAENRLFRGLLRKVIEL